MQKNGWAREYEEIKGTPSSLSSEASPAISYFVDFLKKSNAIVQGRLLDLGCGNGRNSIPLAKMGLEVYGIDFIPSALSMFVEKAASEGVDDKVHLIEGELGKPLPYQKDFFDFSMDITSFDNLLKKSEIEVYISELGRVLKKGGLFLIQSFSKNDGYYGPLLGDSDMKGKGIVYDKNSGIRTKIYSQDDLAGIFGKRFQVLDSCLHKSKEIVYGREYGRVSFSMVLKNRR
ncbi:MAG: class I SAM-dependent methyltransferase [Candidatus Altiarchaeota archaeon]|nr:class I SAM-dependent methyltransferase [Candidatus Altiarchaeota archaeon]